MRKDKQKIFRKKCDYRIIIFGFQQIGYLTCCFPGYYESNRKSKPFVALNCSAFPKDLLESELFGHAEGAYTGATKSKKGYIEEAHEGTLFLDEIGEMNIDLQSKLLRVLETGDFYRVDESKSRHVNVRFIAATNRDIEKEAEAGGTVSAESEIGKGSVFSFQLPVA